MPVKTFRIHHLTEEVVNFNFRTCAERFRPNLERVADNSDEKEGKSAMDLGEVCLEKLKLWSTEALKYFFGIQRLSIDGTFDELVAR